MVSINAIIYYFGATRMVESNDNDIFENQESVEVITSNEELLIDVTNAQPFKATEDKEKDSYFLKWEKCTNFTDNIIGDVKGGVKTMRQI